MGEVYRARDTRLDRTVAVKVLPASLADDPQLQERFEREARTIAALNHPHICTLHDVGASSLDARDPTSKAATYLVMEFLDGRVLRDVPKPLSAGAIVDLAIQVADALDVAHAAGIVHRDLKPANIFLTERGVAKVLDFGVAKLMPQRSMAEVSGASELPTVKGSDPLTGTGTTVGTLAYMAPEQARGDRIDGRSDIFSLGAVLYEMATGRAAFAGQTAAVVFDEILNRAPASVNALVPPGLDRIITRALEKAPALRYQSAADMRADLLRLKRDLDSGGVPTHGPTGERRDSGPVLAAASGPSPPPAVDARWGHGRSPLIVFGLVLLSALGLAGWIWGFGSSGGVTIDSVAVLPFVNDSGSADADYLSEGLADTITNQLSQIETLRVVPRALVAPYRGQAVDVREAADDLNVRAVVTGRVVQRGERLTVQVELIDAETVDQIWGEQFDRAVADVLGVQTEISSAIIDSLRVRLTEADEERVADSTTGSEEAYQAYLRGRYEWNKRTREGLDRATRYFEEAIRIDPEYAVAYAGLAHAYLVKAFYGYQPASEALRASISAATRALEIDEDSVDARVALGYNSIRYEWDWTKSEREFDRALALDPENAAAHAWHANLPLILGRFDEALRETRQGARFDPLSPGFYLGLGFTLTYAREYDDAVAALEQALDLEPAFGAAHRYLASVYRLTGQVDLAVEADRMAIALGDPIGQVDLAASLAAAGDREEALTVLEPFVAEVRQLQDWALNVALVYAYLGDVDEAFAWLDEAYEYRDQWLPFLNVNPEFDVLRADPRFDELVARVGIPTR